MTTKKTVSMAVIARELRSERFRKELMTDWAVEVFYRVPSIPLVWLAARLGIRPTNVSLAALLLALSLPVQAVFLTTGAAAIAIFVFGAVFQILDCTDGTLARVTGRVSKTGGDVDFLTDMAQWGLLYLALGILADRTLGVEWIWAAVGASAAWVRLYARVIRDRLKKDDGPAAPVAAPTMGQLPVVFLTGLSGAFPAIALAGPWIWLGVIFLLIYGILDVGDALLPHLTGRA